MVRPTSAGVAVYRKVEGRLEVLLVHPSGNYNRKKPWSLPKGLPDPGESLEAAARRETWEETGVTVDGPMTALGSVQYLTKSRKVVFAWAALAPESAAPCCASWEVDKAEFVPLPQAYTLLHPDQRAFLERLETLLRRDAVES